jgi:hypothetical protein
VTRYVGALAAALVLAGCSGEAEPAGEAQRTAPEAKPRAVRDAAPPRARCPAELSNCREASGRIVYVERVDPDGDGDAHFVLLSRAGITGPGLTVVDVKRSLRPSPLPSPGDRLSAAGPVYRGSFGQRQIEAIEVHASR